jgi:DNA relaxase NicK
MSRATDVVTNIACDYITGTTKERDLSLRLYDFGSALMSRQCDLGNRKVPWGMKAFSGYQCGSVQLGTRGEECMVRLSSDSASLYWKDVVQHSQNVSRIDLQSTVRVQTDVARRIDSYRRAAQRDADKTAVGKVVRWIQEYHGGYTLYLGDRKSNVFGRIYDKHKDTPIDEYQSCVRFEAQFQKKLALFVASQLARQDSQISAMSSYLTQFFASRGIVLELPQESTATYSCPRIRSDFDKNLIWLAAAVKPCILRLIAAGRGEETLRALGLVQDDLDHEA